MGKYQRTKGANGERSIVNILKGYGFDAKRISMMETNGSDKGDITLQFPFEKTPRNCQVKVGDQVPVFVYKSIEGFDILFMRKDRKDWIVSIDLDTFVYLLMKNFETK